MEEMSEMEEISEEREEEYALVEEEDNKILLNQSQNMCTIRLVTTIHTLSNS